MAYERVGAGLPVWRLAFDDHPDLVVRVTVPTLEARALVPKVLPLLRSRRAEDVTAAISRLAVPFADSLLSWDLTWAGRPVKPTRRGVLRVDQALMLEILTQWIKLWTAPPRREQESSTSDDDAAALAELPMVALDPETTVDIAPVGELDESDRPPVLEAV